MVRSAAALLLTYVISTAAAAQPAPDLQCPIRPEVTLSQVIYMWALNHPETFAMCVYADRSTHSIRLEGNNCSVEPVDVIADGNLGGMHECNETEPGRCRVVCRSP